MATTKSTAENTKYHDGMQAHGCNFCGLPRLKTAQSKFAQQLDIQKSKAFRSNAKFRAYTHQAFYQMQSSYQLV